MNGQRSWTSMARAPRRGGRALVKLYRYTLSPLIGFHCRHLPTCSDYADEALERHGLWAGGWMTLARLLRCHPYGTSGLDFVPDRSRRGRGGICRGDTAAGAEPSRALNALAQVSNFRFRSRMTVVNSRMSSSICLAIGSGVPLPGLKPMALNAFTDASACSAPQRAAELGDHSRRRALRRHQPVPAGHDEILQARARSAA